ncbi:hypothetical protein [Methanosphaera cuniculi]|uniref:beta strand repeat-containing protein n=1 Tax=Methanosphaera cuniculi TaxID=1077256 RepID=UPI0026EDAC7F|nr:hypothetical protein [Methanosphaera cuniculi]
MNKNGKFLFVGLTLLLLCISIGAISAVDINDTTTSISDNTADNTHDIISSKVIKTSEDVKTTNKNPTKKIKQADKQTKKEQTTEVYTVDNYETLKTSWNNIQENGNNETQYTLNIKNGKYNFEEELKAKPSNETRYITLNGEDVTKTIFDGQNKTRLFNLNNTNQVIKFNNITFTNGNNTNGGAIRDNSTTTYNNTQFINNQVFSYSGTYGGAILIEYNTEIYNSKFINNTATTIGGYAGGGALYCGANVTIYNCKFINNSAVDAGVQPIAYQGSGNGGSIYASGSSKEIINITFCEFRDNHAISNVSRAFKGSGGAIYDTSYETLNIYNCNFFNNSGNYGGAIRFDNGASWKKANPNVIGCVFANNTAITDDPNISKSFSSTTKLNIGSVLFMDNSETSILDTMANGKKLPTFNQKTKNITIFCLSNTNDYYGPLTNLGLGQTLQLESSSNLINTTGVKFTPENEYTVTLDTSKLPANHENITLTVEGIEVAKIVWDYTNVEFNNITAKPGNTITLKSTFKTSDNKYIPSGKVAFKINGKTVGHSNIRFGTATLNYTIPENYSAKDYILTTTYGGSSDFIEARINSTLHLEKLATKTDLTTSIEGNTLKITVDPRDENNKTVNRGKICVKIEGKTLQTLKITGKTTVNFTIPKSWNNREIKVLAIYGENNNHKESRCEIKTKLVLHTKTTKKDNTINNYYVSDKTGSDTNTGTQNSPFKTILKAITTVTNNKQNANIYLDGQFKGVGNTNLTVPGDLHINFIGVGNSSIDGEVNYTLKYNLTDGEYYWGSSVEWRPYENGKGNWAMSITKGEGLITISNFTIKNCWNAGGSSIAAYKTATIDNYGNLAVNNVSFIFNHGGVGASIRNNNGANVNITDSLFEANRKSSSTGNYGSGIYNNGTAIIINSTFQKNYARWGTITNDKNMTIINSTIRDNIGYNGGSTYDAGSAIAINTESSNFYESLSLSGINTIIDGCYFTNNDQIDIYGDLSQNTIINNVFNKSTGITLNGNQSFITNITNNTIDSPVASNIYSSLTNTNPYLITFRLLGDYKYYINSNRILNVNGTKSKAMEFSGHDSVITNNTFTREITVSGDNNIISGNNITTSIDDFAIELRDYKNNTISDNYLESKILKGNSAVNYTSLTNKVENNKPEVKEIEVDDATFYKFFDDDGNLLDSYTEIEQIQVIGSLNNKNMNFNKPISLVQKGKSTSYNVTIKTTADIEFLSFNITNTNQQPILTANNNAQVKNSYLFTDNEYVIVLNGENNTIENNTLVADLLVGNEAVKTDKTNNITLNTPTYKNYILSEGNFNTYFNTDGTIKLNIEDIHFLVNGTITNKNIIISNNRNVTLTNYRNAKFVNTTIKTEDRSSLNMSFITVENNNDKTAIQLGVGDHKINYCNITTNANFIDVGDANTLEIKSNNIKTIGSNSITTINMISLKGKAEIRYNNITTQTNKSQAITIKATNNQTANITIVENIITTSSNNAISMQLEHQKVSIRDNTLNITGANSVGLKLSNITSLSGQLSGSNTITINDENSIGILLANTTSTGLDDKIIVFVQTIIYNSNININAHNSIGILINNVTNSSINLANIKVNDDSIAVLVNNSNYTQINAMNIESTINDNNISPIMVNSSTQTNITRCNISTTSKYSVIIDEKSQITRVKNNTLFSQYLGDKSVLNLNIKYNEVANNRPESISYFYLNEATYNEYFDKNGNLLADVPENITILTTGSLYNKTLNINKPITIMGNGITFFNTTLNINSDNVNITEITFKDNAKITINANNCNLDINEIDLTKDDSDTIFTINGNNNTIKVEGRITLTATDEKSNLTIMKITGNKNNIRFEDIIESYNYNYVLGFLLDNANNTILNDTSALWLEALNTTGVILNNSNNNTIRLNQYESYATEDFQGIILTNSSNNEIIGSIRGEENPANILLKLENNSNYNKIEGLDLRGYNLNTTPVQIIDSHYNKIYNCQVNFKNLIGPAINIKEGVGNNVTYNTLTTASLQGDLAVLQENKNNTMNNQVRYNFAKSGSYAWINSLTTSGDAKAYHTITITVKTTREAGHIVFTVNGEEIGVVDVVNKTAEINYTIKPTDGNSLNIKATFEDPELVYRVNSRTTTVAIEKLDSKVLMANITNKGTMSTTTAIILDEMGNIVYDGNVTFTLDDVNKTVAIKNGIAQATFDTSSYKLGEYNITATFNGNDVCNIANNTVTLTVEKYDVNVIVNPTTALSGNKVLLKANVTDINGKAVNSGRVVFKLNGCTLKDENGNPIYANVINGTATVEYMIPAHYSAKNYTLTAVASSSTYNRTEANSTLTINKTTLKAQVVPTTVKRTNNTTITVKFTDDKNNDIIGENKVCIKFNGKTLINTKATNGTVNVNLDLTNYKNKQYELTVICGENSKYNTCKNVSTLILE